MFGVAQTAKAESAVDSKRDNEEKKTLCVFSLLVRVVGEVVEKAFSDG